MFHRLLTLSCLGTLATMRAQTDDETAAVECPGNFQLVQNEYCYFISTQEATWDDANEVCESMSGWLVKLESTHQNYGLLMWLEDNGINFATFFSGPYIGIRRFDTSTEDFTWSHEPDRDSGYTNWKTDIPYITDELNNCGVMTADSSWFNFKCTDRRDYVCQINYGTTSPSPAPTDTPTLVPSSLPTQHDPPTVHPTAHPTAHPTSSPVRAVTHSPSSVALIGNGGDQDIATSDSHNVDVNVHVSYIIVGLGVLLMLVALHRRGKLSPLFSFLKKDKGVRLDDSDTENSSHNLVEMETRKTYGEDNERHSSEEIDMGGCFAFSNSSAEEMLASQLNVKVYSAVNSDLNSS